MSDEYSNLSPTHAKVTDTSACQTGIPAQRTDRLALREHVRRYAAQQHLTPPLSLSELMMHTEACLAAGDFLDASAQYTAVLLSNAVWQDTLAAVPFERRLLLLPQCLRNTSQCKAPIDAYGLTCQRCGGCQINELLDEAERLGYVTLVAEGAALVMSLIETGRVEAIIGVSCLTALEQVFPYMEAGAVPGLALPLLKDGCGSTTLDVDWLWEMIYLASPDVCHRTNIDTLREEVEGLFTGKALSDLLGPAETQTDTLGRDWLGRAGKRWRPLLLAAAWEALSDSGDDLPRAVQQLAVAVECFHKASLIHDDIEDNDPLRYGRASLHAAHGIAPALNVGDLLIGEGYRLIAQAGREGLDSDTVAEMLAVASAGHRDLCLGQGEDLAWTRKPRLLSLDEALDIVRRKTAPPFEIALRLGCLAARGNDARLAPVLREFSQAIGIAYQTRDDLQDIHNGDLLAHRPSVLLALAWEAIRTDPRNLDGEVLLNSQADPDAARKLLAELDIDRRAHQLLDGYKQRAMSALSRLTAAPLKALLRRLVGKIFCDVDIMTCCEDLKPYPPTDPS